MDRLDAIEVPSEVATCHGLFELVGPNELKAVGTVENEQAPKAPGQYYLAILIAA